MSARRVDPSRLEAIRRMVAQNMTLVEMGKVLGTTKENVRQLCLRYGIHRERAYKLNPNRKDRRGEHKMYQHVTPIDPEKARAITEHIKAHWRKLGVAS